VLPPDSALAPWLARQRWFAGKHAPIARITPVATFGPARIVDVDGDRYLLTDLDDPAVRAAWWTLATSPQDPSEPAPASRLLGAEQSNSSLLFGESALLKVFRRLHPGENPDYEIPRALAALPVPFPNVPAALGRVVWNDCTLAVLHAFVPNLGDGWAYALAHALTGDELHLLGRRTRALHAALEAAFGAEATSADDLARWRTRTPGPHQALAPALAPLLGTGKIRIHGDFHLGQTLKTADDWMIIDFEGEPARPLLERRRRGSPLQDVAGMLRSFGYLAAVAQRAELEAPARAAFLAGYGPIAYPAALRFFEAEKAAYELAYERAHRPDWAHIPERALARLLA